MPSGSVGLRPKGLDGVARLDYGAAGKALNAAVRSAACRNAGSLAGLAVEPDNCDTFSFYVIK
jgi:hypothetical protein